MKKFVTAIILVCMMLSMAACGGSSEAEYKLGMGVVVSTDSSSDNNAQVDATVATVVTDANGKIVLCRLDCAQNKMDVTGGAVDTAKTFLTKRELGDDYNMVKYSNATLEWYQQAENFEAYCVGKTADEIAGIETKVNEEGYNVAVDETLYASCSISIEDFIGAVVKACSDEKGQTFKASGELKLGLAAITTAAESTPATDTDPAAVKMYTDFGATVVGADGKDGLTPFIGENGNWWIGEKDTGVKAAAEAAVPAGSGNISASSPALIVIGSVAGLALLGNLGLILYIVLKKKKSLV